jgi:hypothetical protein
LTLKKEKKRLRRLCLRGLRKCGCLRTSERLWADTTGVGGSAPLGLCQPTPALWGLFLLRRVLVLEVGCFLLSFCSRIRLCFRILWRWWTAMRWRSLHTLLAVSLGSPKRRRELRVWSVKMVPAVPTRMGQMFTLYPRVWLR